MLAKEMIGGELLYILKWLIWGPAFIVGLLFLLSGELLYGILLWGSCWAVVAWQWKTWNK
jgi:hypothetical protein